MRAKTDGSGAVTAEYTYDAYGTATSSAQPANGFGYAREYVDSESGLYYLRARYYDPATQQFLTRDPLVAWTEQAYNYVAGSPLNYTDPSGLYLVTEDRGGGALAPGTGGIGDAVGTFGAYTRDGFAPKSGTGVAVRAQMQREAQLAAQEAAQAAANAAKGTTIGPSCPIDIVYRRFDYPATGSYLSRKAAEALQNLGVYGVSATLNPNKFPGCPSCERIVLEQYGFHVKPTSSNSDPAHVTIMMPNRPVTKRDADLFNWLFGMGPRPGWLP